MLVQAAQQNAKTTGRQFTWTVSLPIQVGLDLLLISLGFWLAYLLRYHVGLGGAVAEDDQRPFNAFLPVFLLLVAILLGSFSLRGLYRLSRWTSTLDEVGVIIGGAVSGFCLLTVIVFYYRDLYFSRLVLIFAFLLVCGLLVVRRVVWYSVRMWLRSRGRWVDRVLVVGAGTAGERVMSLLIGQPELGFSVIGFVDDDLPEANWAVATQRMVVRPRSLGTCDDLADVLQRHQIDGVILALQPTAHDRLRQLIEVCRALEVPFTLLPDLFELSLDRFEIHQVSGLPLISVKDTGIRGLNALLKRTFDFLFASLVLLLGALPIAVIALLIKLDSPGPVFYRQQRVGKDGRHFTCFKFRSMQQDADQQVATLAASAHYSGDPKMFKLKDDPRRTRVGKFLRRTSLDELPNLINVLRGEMSVVGPRPHLPSEVALYEPWQRRRLAIMPGLTCLWQVNGRSNLTFEEQARLDIYYAEHWSFWLDIKIILRTVPAVLTARGAY